VAGGGVEAVAFLDVLGEHLDAHEHRETLGAAGGGEPRAARGPARPRRRSGMPALPVAEHLDAHEHLDAPRSPCSCRGRAPRRRSGLPALPVAFLLPTLRRRC
jgi:hypothetical protein